jgi:ankyrin repeat protein
LEVAFCYGYGIGTQQDWNECEAWIDKAASKGSVAALTLARRLKPLDNQKTSTNENEADGDFEALAGSSVRYLQTGLHDEHLRVRNLIQETDPELYDRFHAKFATCFCERPETEAIEGQNMGPLENLFALWAHIRQSPTGSLPESVEVALKIALSETSATEFTLLHAIALSCHSPVNHGQFDIVRLIGEILISKGCPLNGGEDTEKTPLAFATISRNFTIIDLLLEQGAEMRSPWSPLERLAGMHDWEVLEKLMPMCFRLRSKWKSQFIDRCRIFAHVSICVPYPQRKLSLGTGCEIKGVKTLTFLLELAYQDFIPLDDSLKLLSGAITAGNADLFKLVLPRVRTLSNVLASPIPKADVTLLQLSILFRRVDLFLILLEQGADINHKVQTPSYPGWAPIHFAAHVVPLEPVFFEELVSRKVDLKAINQRNESVLEFLVKNVQGAAYVNLAVSNEPSLLDSGIEPVLHRAAFSGCCKGVQALLERGSDVRRLDNSGKSAITYAVLNSGPESIENLKVLISGLSQLPSDDTARILGEGLQTACQIGNVVAVKQLLASGANPNYTKTQDDYRTPLYWVLDRWITFSESTETRMWTQKRLEKFKFDTMRQLLIRFGVDETQGYGPLNITAEEYYHLLGEFFYSGLPLMIQGHK